MPRHPDRHPNPAHRTEPTLGSLESTLSPAEAPTRMQAPSRPRQQKPVKTPIRWGWWVALALLVGGGLWAWSERDTLRALVPNTQLNAILERADQAFAAGTLVGNDGNSARELYSAARALSPDSERALAGLQKVGEAQLQLAEQAFKAGKLDQAGHALEQARALLGGGKALDQLASDIAAARARGSRLANLLERAQQARADGRLDGPGGAAALYQEMLTADPANAVARHGLDGIGRDLATALRQALAAGKLAEAQQGVQQLGNLLPGFAELPALRASVAAAQAKADAARDALLKQAAADLAAGHLAGAGEANALARYRAVLALDADNADAHAGLRAVAAALVKQAEADIRAGRLDVAATALDQALTVAPDSVALADARAHLKAARQAPTVAATVSLSAADRAKAQALITRAQAAAVSGDLVLPPGDSAYDLYRSALAIDDNNADALAGLATLPATARSLFEQALDQRDPDLAADRMAAFAALAPGSTALPALRSQLAAAWFDQASRNADMGKLAEARRALGKARSLAPNDSRIAVLTQRLGG
ncbi:MAG TPA: hypothetical protein VFN09_07975 [Rhodanobacteraceae bacterium]|nr:hypothetical protein [Rhodanobacteraceae bacterium]